MMRYKSKLYNWYIASPTNAKKIAPAGWHVPSDAEWDTLQNYLIAKGYNWDGTTTGNKIAKALMAKADWHAYAVKKPAKGTPGADLPENNSSGFSALPVGVRYGSLVQVERLVGNFSRSRGCISLWSASECDASTAYGFSLCSYHANLARQGYDKSCGYSIRLLRD